MLVAVYGEASDEVQKLDELISKLGDRAQFDEVAKQFRLKMEALRVAEEIIDADQKREGFSNEEAERRKLEAQREIRKEVYDTLAGLERIADRTGDQELKQHVAELRIEWEKLGVKIDEVGRSINEGIKQDLKDTLASIIRDVRHAGDALLSLVNGILDRIAKMLADRIFGPGGVLEGVLGGKGKNGSAGGFGGILSKILGYPSTRGNLPTSGGTITVQGGTPPFNGNNLISAIGNFQSGTFGHLTGIKGNTFSTVAELRGGFGGVQSKVQEVITFLPNLIPAQSGPSLLQKLVELGGAIAQSKVGQKHKAGGGLITGPGTDTSDSIPAMLSDGKFVLRAAAVRNIGADVLAWINRVGRLPLLHLAMGGSVGFDVSALSAVADRANVPASIGAMLDDRGGSQRPVVNVTIQTPTPHAFKQSERAVEQQLARAVERAMRRNIASRK